MAINSWVSSFAELTEKLPQLVVEKYQRPYSWGEDQIKRLFEEHFYPLVDGTDLTHLGEPFVGTVVVMPVGEKTYEIIDGQQRCSTMTMIYAEAYRTLRDCDGSFDNRSAARFLATDEGGAWIRMKSQDFDIYRVLVAPAGSRRDIDEFYDKAITLISETKGPAALGAITEVRNFIIKYIEDYVDVAGKTSGLGKVEALQRLLTAIRDTLKVVTVEVDGHGQGLAVFESLNTVGLPLTLEQLIRNCLMKAFNDDQSHNAIDQFWDGSGGGQKSFHGSINKPEHRTDFLNHYYQAFHGSISANNAYNHYKKLAGEVKKGEHHKSLVHWLVHMQHAWKFYASFKGPLRTLGGKAVYPALLVVNSMKWDNDEDSVEAINRVAFALESALLRTQFCNAKLTTLSAAIVVLCGEIRRNAFAGIRPRDLESFVRNHLRKAVPDDSVFSTAIENNQVKHESRRVELMLRRLNYAESVGIRDIHENIGMDQSLQGDVVHAVTPLQNPSDKDLQSLGFGDFGEYIRLTRSLANVIISPSSGAAARVPANMGLSSNKVSFKLLKSRSKALARRSCEIWKI